MRSGYAAGVPRADGRLGRRLPSPVIRPLYGAALNPGFGDFRQLTYQVAGTVGGESQALGVLGAEGKLRHNRIFGGVSIQSNARLL